MLAISPWVLDAYAYRTLCNIQSETILIIKWLLVKKKKRIRFYLYNQIRSVRLDPYRITERALFKKNFYAHFFYIQSVKQYSDRNRWIALDRLPKFCIKYLKQHEHKHIM